MEQNNQRNPRRRLNSLILLVAFTAIMLIVSTYAWFSTQKNVSLANLTGTVKVAEGLMVSLDAKNWSNSIDFSEIDQATQLPYMVYKATTDTSDDTTVHNIVPSELLPVSTTGVEGVGQTEMTFYRGTHTDGDDLNEIKAVTKSVAGLSAASNPDTYPGYYAIDFFLQNSSSLTYWDEDANEGAGAEVAYTGDALFETLQLNADSAVQVKADGNATVGLQNTPRVAFAMYNNSNNLYVGGDGDKQDKVIDYSMGTATIKDIAIWEPNASSHEDYIVTNNNRITWLAADRTAYLADTTEPYTYAATERIPTYALKADAVGKAFTDLYNWSGALKDADDTTEIGYQYVQKQITLQTDKSAASYLINGGVKNLITIDTPETCLYTNSPSGTPEELKMPRNEVCRVRMYIWLEGQDVDCINYASHGGGIEVDVGLIKGAEEGSGVS